MLMNIKSRPHEAHPLEQNEANLTLSQTSAEKRTLALGGLGWAFESYDSFLLSLLLPVLGVVFAVSKTELGLFISTTAGGQIIGGILFGMVADKIGRVRTAFICITIYSLFSGLLAFSHHQQTFVLLRFCGALGMGGMWTSGAALIAETWRPERRARGGALMQMGLPVGAILAIGLTALVTAMTGKLENGGWRYLFMIGALPVFIMMVIAYITPESPVWLARQRERINRPTQTARSGKTNLKGLLLAFTFIFFIQYLFWGVFTWTPTYLREVKHLDFLHSLKFVLALQTGAIAGFLVFSLLADKWGRRPMFLIYLFIGAVAVGLYLATTQPLILMAAIFMAGFGVNGIFAGSGPFLAEMIGDTQSRGFLMGLAYNGGRLGGFIAPLLIGYVASIGGFTAGLATTVVAFIAAMVVVWMAPETKGIKLQ
ncbi:Facilitator family transporter permease protein YjhB {ECO:0000313/EMBL:BAK10998.1} [Pantoea ananatis]|uniref:Facilitator family transporter permease protein YjhB n=6 Tax=Bacteria TaxID=2 RepID=A0A0H3KVA4_PANAA|nr:facilitator family transporter permease protein YjhB [Pantoea ananatis AJ13355]CRH37995.1 Facilitator family transporter permease protein YjhB {ECO:0000313/EMBL:BAK10998.1} [Pantoea ananatis]